MILHSAAVAAMRSAAPGHHAAIAADCGKSTGRSLAWLELGYVEALLFWDNGKENGSYYLGYRLGPAPHPLSAYNGAPVKC